jgi:hypothetical protein
VELQDFYLKHTRGPDDRTEIGAGRAAGEAGEGDFLRAVAEAVLQLLMETDVEGLIGAGRYERSGERTTWRNGYRDRTPRHPARRTAAAHPEFAAEPAPAQAGEIDEGARVPRPDSRSAAGA